MTLYYRNTVNKTVSENNYRGTGKFLPQTDQRLDEFTQ